MRKLIVFALLTFLYITSNIPCVFSATSDTKAPIVSTTAKGKAPIVNVAPEPKVSIADKTVAQGGAVSIDIEAKNSAKDTIGIDIWVKYDPNILEAKTAVKGSLTNSGSIVVNTKESGVVKIVLFSVEPFSYGKGNLATINFTVKGTALPGTESILSFSKVQFNDRSICPCHLRKAKLKITAMSGGKQKKKYIFF